SGAISGLAIKHTLDVTQFGMLRKDDPFEVVFNPGTDKVEKRGLGPVPVHRGDTGRSPVTTAQPRVHGATERYKFIGISRIGQFVSEAEGWLGRWSHAVFVAESVPIGESTRSGDGDLRCNYHGMKLGQVF